MFEAETVIEIKLEFIGNGFWSVFEETELQIDQKLF